MDPTTVAFGVDPGKTGAIVGLTLAGKVLHGIDMPVDEVELCAFWQLIAHNHSSVEVVVEKVWSNPKWGKRHCFEFGRQRGRIETAITAAGLDYRRVPPTTWQRYFGMKKTPFEKIGYKGQKEWKKRLQALAVEKFDGRVTLSRADAYLQAEYCRLNTMEGWV